MDCLLQVNSKANPREPLWTEVQTFTFYSLVLPSFRSLSLSLSLSGWHSAETWVACACAGGSCGSGESGGLVSLVACLGHPPAGTVHLPSTTAAFWLRFKRPLLHWLSLSSNLSQMFKLEDSKICPQGGCMQILPVTNRFRDFGRRDSFHHKRTVFCQTWFGILIFKDFYDFWSSCLEMYSCLALLVGIRIDNVELGTGGLWSEARFTFWKVKYLMVVE